MDKTTNDLPATGYRAGLWCYTVTIPSRKYGDTNVPVWARTKAEAVNHANKRYRVKGARIAQQETR